MNKPSSPENQGNIGTLFGGSPVMRWAVGPVALLAAAIFGLYALFMLAAGEAGKAAVSAVLTVACGLLFLAVACGPRFHWAGRVLTGLVFGAYAWYLLDTWILHPKPLGLGASRGSATPWNALCGLVFIGLPCLCYASLGRVTLRAPKPSEDEDLDDDAEDDDSDDDPEDHADVEEGSQTPDMDENAVSSGPGRHGASNPAR